MFQRFEKRRDAHSACNLRDHARALRHFGDHAASSFLICRLKAGCATCSVLAACRKLPVLAISANDTNCRRSKGDSEKVSWDRIKVFESNADCRQFDRMQQTKFQECQRLNRTLNGQRKEAIDKYR
jgi:hypothetical protein